MTDELDHADVSELLSVYAVDAADPAEVATVERHLAGCPRCRAELDALREVIAALGTATEQPPPGLWDRIHIRLDVPKGGPEPLPMPSLPAVGAVGDTPPTPRGKGTAARHRTRRRRTAGLAALCVAGVAAIVVIALLATSLQSVNTRVARIQALLTEQARATEVATALATPGHTIVPLRSPTGIALASAIVVPGGHGVLRVDRLATLTPGTTYQLWIIKQSEAVSIGVLGARPVTSSFTASGAVGAYVLALTVEQAGGTAQPTSAPIAEGATST